jgi:hypothetical protein
VTRILIEALLLVGAYVAGVLTHKWLVDRAKSIIQQAADVAKKA